VGGNKRGRYDITGDRELSINTAENRKNWKRGIRGIRKEKN